MGGMLPGEGLSWDVVWWACQDLNLGPLPYQGIDATAQVAILTL
jgi:hypothetical protein